MISVECVRCKKVLPDWSMAVMNHYSEIGKLGVWLCRPCYQEMLQANKPQSMCEGEILHKASGIERRDLS